MCLHDFQKNLSSYKKDVDQKTILACSCYRGVRGDHCIHKLATEMHLGERKKPSEEKKLSSRRKRGRVAKNSKIDKS